jgi:integrase
MGGVAEAWKIRPRGRDRVFYVRFSHQGHRYEESTGERDPREASRRAAEIYARIVTGAGRRKPGALSPKLPFDELAAEWIVTLQNTHAQGTRDMYEIHVKTLVRFFPTLDRITSASIEDFAQRRLGEVLRDTMLKERSTLRNILRWLVRQGTLETMPEWPDVPRRATGTPATTRKTQPVEITPEQASAAIDLLPERSPGRRGGKGSFIVRAWARVAWETGLRPITIARLEVPTHYTKGARMLTITDEIDKARFGRMLPLTPAAREALDSVVPVSGPIFGHHRYLELVKKAGKAIGLSKDFSPYDFRHGRGTELVEKSGNLVGTAFLMGHKKVTTTEIYVRPNLAAGQRALAAASGSWGTAGAQALPAPSDDRDLSIVDPQNPKGPETLSSPDPVGASGFEPPTPRPPVQRSARSRRKSGSAVPQTTAGNSTPEPPPGALPQGDPGARLASEVDRLNAFGPQPDPEADARRAELRGLARCGAVPEVAALELLEAQELLAGAAS